MIARTHLPRALARSDCRPPPAARRPRLSGVGKGCGDGLTHAWRGSLGESSAIGARVAGAFRCRFQTGIACALAAVGLRSIRNRLARPPHSWGEIPRGQACTIAHSRRGNPPQPVLAGFPGPERWLRRRENLESGAARSACRIEIAREVMHELRHAGSAPRSLGMHVHVHFFGGRSRKSNHRGKNSRRQHVAIRLMNRNAGSDGAAQPPVHGRRKFRCGAALHVGRRHKPAHNQFGGALLGGQFGSVIAARMGEDTGRISNSSSRPGVQNSWYTRSAIVSTACVDDSCVGVFRTKLASRMRQRIVRDERTMWPVPWSRNLRKFAARHAVKKIGHADRSSRWKPFRLDAHELAAGNSTPRSFLFSAATRSAAGGDRRDRR